MDIHIGLNVDLGLWLMPILSLGLEHNRLHSQGTNNNIISLYKMSKWKNMLFEITRSQKSKRTIQEYTTGKQEQTMQDNLQWILQTEDESWGGVRKE